MIFHKQRKSIGWLVLLVGMLITVGVLWQNQQHIITGETVSIEQYPYRYLAYTKLTHQGGNFTGDVYVLDVDTGETTQLTEGW